MDPKKWAVVVDQNPLKGQHVERLLKQYYSLVYRPQGEDIRNVSGFVDMNNASIDVIVAGGDYGNMAAIMEQHKRYGLPVILRLDRDMRISPDLLLNVANGDYRLVAFMGMPADLTPYIEAAQKRAAALIK